MKTVRKKKIDAKRAGRYYVDVSIGYRDIQKLVKQVGQPNRWHIEYGDYMQLKAWVNKYDPTWPKIGKFIECHTLFGIPLFKREYVEPNRLRLVNEFTEASLFVDFDVKHTDANRASDADRTPNRV